MRHGLRLGVIAIPHTFNGRLAFNSHVHTMVTEGGLNESSDIWVSRVYYDRDRLMKAWWSGPGRVPWNFRQLRGFSEEVRRRGLNPWWYV